MTTTTSYKGLGTGVGEVCNPSPFLPRLAALAKFGSPLPQGEVKKGARFLVPAMRPHPSHRLLPRLPPDPPSPVGLRRDKGVGGYPANTGRVVNPARRGHSPSTRRGDFGLHAFALQLPGGRGRFCRFPIPTAPASDGRFRGPQETEAGPAPLRWAKATAGRSAGGRTLRIASRSRRGPIPQQKQAPLHSPWTGRYRTRPSGRSGR